MVTLSVWQNARGTPSRLSVRLDFLVFCGRQTVNKNPRTLISSLVLGLVATANGFAQASMPWHDPSKHAVQFVTVEKGIRLEVLDWGGTGRPVVMLAGPGTLHIFSTISRKNCPAFAVMSSASRDAGLALPLIPIRVMISSGWLTTYSRSSTRLILLRRLWLVIPCLERN